MTFGYSLTAISLVDATSGYSLTAVSLVDTTSGYSLTVVSLVDDLQYGIYDGFKIHSCFTLA